MITRYSILVRESFGKSFHAIVLAASTQNRMDYYEMLITVYYSIHIVCMEMWHDS